MSRSAKKTPVKGNTSSRSEKRDKQAASRRLRREVARAIEADPETEVLPHTREVSDPWLMDKDGKRRFDPKKHPKSMRK
jgi:hypothetical protein